MRAERLLETAIYGQDLDAMEQFYVELAPPSLWNGLGYRAAEAIPPGA